MTSPKRKIALGRIALRLAKEDVKQGLRDQGMKVSHFTAKEIAKVARVLVKADEWNYHRKSLALLKK